MVVQGYFVVDWLVFMDFEICDGFMCFGDQWFLVGNCGYVGQGIFDGFMVCCCFIYIYIQGDFGDFWYFYDVIVIQFFFEFWYDLFVVNFFQIIYGLFVFMCLVFCCQI